MEAHLVTVALSIAGPAILGLFGFLWRVNSKISVLERDIKAHDQRIRNNSQQLSKHFDKAFTIRKNVD